VHAFVQGQDRYAVTVSHRGNFIYTFNQLASQGVQIHLGHEWSPQRPQRGLESAIGTVFSWRPSALHCLCKHESMTARDASGLAASGGIAGRLTIRRSQPAGGNSLIRAVALLSVILIGLTGCGASSKNRSGDTGGEPGAGTVVSDVPLANLDPSVRDASSFARGMTYRSRSGIDDDNTHVTGSVFVPKG
jgi:hypothetical protein